jgi:glyoxylase-like metal-dependent hydrolase (beta-lactamase superfamily II)
MTPAFLHARNPGPFTGAGNWTYLIDGSPPVLIDAGTGAGEHLDAIAAAIADRPLHLLVTHAHSDHISGAPAILSRWPSTVISKHPWPARDKDLPIRVLHDGDVVATGQGDLRVVHTPGHAPDHLCFFHEESGTLFAGDMLQQGTTIMIPASHGGSVTEYLQSLERLLRLGPRRALPAHGPAIEDPPALIRYYIEHRAERERQVVAALAAGVTSVEAMVATIYRGLEESLLPMARESVLAHLVKLEREGRANRDGDSWSATD